MADDFSGFLVFDQKVVDPFIKSLNLSPQEEKDFRKKLTETLVGEMLIKIIKALPEEKKKELKEKLKGQTEVKEQIKIFQEIAGGYPETAKLAAEFFKNDLPHFFEEMIDVFISNASKEEEQRLQQNFRS